MEPQLQALLDRERIVETINRLFIATDQRDWPAVADCLAPAVHLDMTSLAGGEPATLSPAEITAAWEAGLRSLTAIHHQAGNHLVRLDGDKAEAFCYGIAHHYRPHPSGRNTRTFVGSYDFGLRRHADGWRIDRFRFNLKYIDGNAQLDQP